MRFEDGNIYFNLIIVIQSLNDRATGLELYDDILKRFTWKDPSLQAEIYNVHTRDELMGLLGELENRCKSRSTLPFVHFETHGTKDGILLTSGEEVHWKEIGPALGTINSHTGNNLFISVAACYGGNIQFLVNVSKPCPFRGFIGPMDEIYPSEVITSFVPFFEELLNTDDFHSAIKSLNRANAGRLTFHHMNAEAFFDAVVELYSKELHSNSKDGKILEGMVESLWVSPEMRMRFTKPKLKRFIQNRRNGLLELLNGFRPRFLHLS